MVAKKKSKVRFGGNIVRTAREEKKRGSSSRYFRIPKGIDLFKEEVTPPKNKKARTKLDIIPYKVTDPKHPHRYEDDPTTAHVDNFWPIRPVWVHHNVGGEKEKVVCRRTYGKKCPICEYRMNQYQQVKEGKMDKDDVMSGAQLRNMYYVIPRGDKDHEEEVHIWEISQGNFQDVLDEDLQEDEDLGSFPNLEDGLTLHIRFSEGNYAGNKYPEASDIDYYERKEAIDESLLDELPSLDDLLIRMSYKEMEAKFFELDEDEASEEDVVEEEEEENETRRRPKSSKKKPTDEKDEDEEEEEEEEPAPKKRKTSKKKVEDEQEEEEEEEPTPKRKAKTTGKKKPADDEEEEEQPKAKRKTSKKKTQDNGDECPHDHRFGHDWDEYDECPDCDKFQKCGEKNEELEK